MGEIWDTPLGNISTRKELAGRYGGSVSSGGIVPSRSTPNVFVFSDPAEGRKWGYSHDGPSSDGSAYFYTGQGTQGEQLLRTGNKALANHALDGRALRLFVATGTVPRSGTKLQRYIGQYQVDPINPFERVLSHDASGRTRMVFVFRLLPVGNVLAMASSSEVGADPADDPKAKLIPREVDSTFFFETRGSAGTTALKGESQLVAEYEHWRGRTATPFERWTIRIPGEKYPLLTDIYDATTSTLFEAKASANRDSVRQAIGQLLDYQRHVPVPELRSSLLLPSKPSTDLRSLIAHSGFGLVYRDGESFSSTVASAL